MGRRICEIVLNNSIYMGTHEDGQVFAYADQAGKVYETDHGRTTTRAAIQYIRSVHLLSDREIALGYAINKEAYEHMGEVVTLGNLSHIWPEVSNDTLERRGPIVRRTRLQGGSR